MSSRRIRKIDYSSDEFILGVIIGVTAALFVFSSLFIATAIASEWVK